MLTKRRSLKAWLFPIALALTLATGYRVWFSSRPALHEKSYQNRFCREMGGRTEVRLRDGTRVDCLTETYAIEIDFSEKWAESVGQSLYYAQMTGKHPAVALIVSEGKRDRRRLARLETLAHLYDIRIYTIPRR